MNAPLYENLLAGYAKNGFTSAQPLLTADEVLEFRGQAEHWDKLLDLMHSDYRCKSQVLFNWVWRLSNHPKLLQYVCALLGDDFACWDAMMWFKKAGDEKYVSPHQDGTYWNFQPKAGLTAWVALTDSTEQSGCVRYYAGTHLHAVPHSDKKHRNNLLMRGQTANLSTVAQDNPVEVTVPAGHVVLHHPLVIHGSGPNNSDVDRLAVGLIYITPEAVPILDYGQESVTNVYGRRNPRVTVDPSPVCDMGRHEFIAWQRAYDQQHANYYKLTQSIEQGDAQ